MSDLDYEEEAQLGLKHIEDAVVNLLTRHEQGLSLRAIGERLGVGSELEPVHREQMMAGVLELLVRSGRILRIGEVFKDNPARS